MKSIIINKKDGTTKEFHHKGRAGGSWAISIRCEGGFAIIKDEWGNETIIPDQDIEEIKTEQFPHF